MTAAAREIELKLTGDPGELERLADWAATQWRLLTPPAISRVRTIYYDTPQLTLAAAGMAARLRQDGDRWLLTLKTAAAGASDRADAAGSVAAIRREWEIPLNGPDCSPATIAQAAAGLAPAGLADALAPRFETAVARTRLLLAPADGVAIELSVDRGTAATEQAQAPISEIELELKRGPVSALYDMALRLLEKTPLFLSSESKADLGLRLLTGRLPRAVAPSPLGLSRLSDVEEARRAALRGAARHLLANLTAAADHDNGAAMAEMRATLRRLRPLLRSYQTTAGSAKKDGAAETTALLKERRRTAAELADVVGWDSLDAQLRDENFPDSLRPGKDLLRAVAAIRRAAAVAARRRLRAPRFAAFLLTLARLGESGDSGAVFNNGENAADAAAETLNRLARRCRKPLAALAAGDFHAAARLTRRLRRLRDAADAARGLFADGLIHDFTAPFAALLATLEAARQAGDAAGRLGALAQRHPQTQAQARRRRAFFTARRDELLRAAGHLCKTCQIMPLRRGDRRRKDAA